MKNTLVRIANALLLAGLILLLVGAYYLVVKAGIPFHDAPLELQVQYAIHNGVGEEIFRDGSIVLALGALGRLGARLWGKR